MGWKASYGLGFPSVVISVGEPDEAPCGLLGAPFARTIKTAETRHERPSRLAPKHIDYNQTSRNIEFFLLLVPPLQRNGRIPSLEQRQGQKLLCSHPIMLFNPKYIYFHLCSPPSLSLCAVGRHSRFTPVAPTHAEARYGCKKKLPLTDDPPEYFLRVNACDLLSTSRLHHFTSRCLATRSDGSLKYQSDEAKSRVSFNWYITQTIVQCPGGKSPKK